MTGWFSIRLVWLCGILGDGAIGLVFQGVCTTTSPGIGAGRSSGGRAPTCKGLDHPIDSGKQMHLQFGLSLWDCDMCWPVCGKVHIKDPLLFIGKNKLSGYSMFCLNKYVTMTTCLTSNSRDIYSRQDYSIKLFHAVISLVRSTESSLSLLVHWAQWPNR